MAYANRARTAWVSIVAAGGYVLLACALTWPLPRHLGTHLLGDPSGDLGVYVWNLWIFRHELIEHAHVPFSTDHVFAYTDGIDFALHNYTPLAGMLGVPLMNWLGLVSAFNVILLAVVAMSGFGVFVLARTLGLHPLAAWCAGALFMGSPVISARTTEHFSLVTAAALPLFVWALLRALERHRIGDCVLVGALVAAATYSDAYYGIYCLLMGVFFVMWQFARLDVQQPSARSLRFARACDGLIALIVGLMTWRLLSGTTSIAVAQVRVGLQTLYTPMLALVAISAARAWLTWRPTFVVHDPDTSLPRLMRGGLVAVVVCLSLLSPMIAGIARRFMAGRLPETETFWRSGPGGVDLLAYVVPNPVHPWFGTTTRSWLSSNGFEGFPEFVASFSLIALAVIAVGAARRALPRVWVRFTVVAILISLGPFVHVAGVNTYVIGPWALLRYVPIIGMAQSPSRFAILAVMGLSLLFAFALAELMRRSSTLRVGGICLAVLLAVEMTPAPRVLYSAEVPAIYRLITENSDDMGTVLELPTGIRDGTSLLGRFSPANQYFQTKHQRAMVGGYVSRVSGWRKQENRRSPVLNAIFELSEGRPLSADRLERAREARTAFLRRTCVRFVVVNKERASHQLREFAEEALHLTLMHEDETFQLLVPVDPPPCDPRRRRLNWPRSDDTPRLAR
jgi:hypothetical protein